MQSKSSLAMSMMADMSLGVSIEVDIDIHAVLTVVIADA
jgi:hypothetical protein